MTNHQPTTPPFSGGARYRVLVVEDGRNAAEVLSLFFEMEGMQTAVAHDGEAAVKLADEFLPHLVCMDLSMPRMDGFEAARGIRAKHRNLILVAICGGCGDELKQRAAAAGFDHYLAKPLNPDDLRGLLRSIPGAGTARHSG